MRIAEKIIVKNESGKEIVFSASSDYHTNIKRDVKGLSDASNGIFTQSGLGQYGETVTGHRVSSKPIEISGHFAVLDKFAVSQLRQNLNNVLSPEENLTVIYQLGNFQRKIEGKAQEISFGASDVYYTFYVSILCPFPLWRDTEMTATPLQRWQGSLEFPLEIVKDSWELGYLDKSSTVNVVNKGDLSCGFKVVFYASTGAIKNPSITNIETGEKIKINVDMEIGDRVEVTTFYRDKTAYLIKADGERQNVIGNFDLSSTFMQLAIGENAFTYAADSGRDKMEITIYHDNLYRGV